MKRGEFRNKRWGHKFYWHYRRELDREWSLSRVAKCMRAFRLAMENLNREKLGQASSTKIDNMKELN